MRYLINHYAAESAHLNVASL